MTINLAANTAANSDAGVSGTTLATTIPSTAVGDGIIVGCGWVDSGAITCTVSDNKGNTYTAVGSKSRNATQGFSVQLFRCTGTTLSASTVTITMTTSVATTFKDIKLEKIGSTNGPWTFDALDAGYGSKVGTGNSTALATASGTPSQDNCAVFTYGAAGSGTINGGTFTLRTTGAAGIGFGDLVQTTAGARAGVLTTSVSSQWTICACAIQDVPAPSTNKGAGFLGLMG